MQVQPIQYKNYLFFKERGETREHFEMWKEALTIVENVLGRDQPNKIHICSCEPYVFLTGIVAGCIIS